MNRQLIAQGFRKLAEAFSLFEEAFNGESELTQEPATTAVESPKAEAKTEPAKKARKSPAPKAAPKVEEPESEEDESEETEDAGEESEGDDFEGMEDEAEEAPAITKDQLRKNIVAYAKKHGKPKAYALLEKFGAKNVDGLKDKDLEKVNDQIQKGLK